MNSVILTALVVLVVLFIVYQYDNSLFGLLGRRERFENMMASMPSMPPMNTANDRKKTPVGPGAVNGLMNAEQNMSADMVSQSNPNQMPDMPVAKTENFADLSTYEGPANFGTAEAPAGCYPRDQLMPSELLPKDMNSIWAQQNPMGTGSLKGKNFLSAGALIGVNTVGQSLRNANRQLRSEPPNPQVPVSIFNQSTISPDISHRPLEIGA
jgi:hypothetical protein